MVALAEELGAEYAGTCNGTEYSDIEYEYELIDYGDAAHGLGAQPAYHYIVDKAYQIGHHHL